MREIHVPHVRLLRRNRPRGVLAPQARRPRGADRPRARLGVREESPRRRPDIGVRISVRFFVEVPDISHVWVQDELRRQALYPRARSSKSAPPAHLLSSARVRDADGRRGGRVLEPVWGFLGFVVREAERREPSRSSSARKALRHAAQVESHRSRSGGASRLKMYRRVTSSGRSSIVVIGDAAAGARPVVCS